MDKKTRNKIRKTTYPILIIAVVFLLYGLSWIMTCGIIKLITMCFGWTFRWSVATGIWLIIYLLRAVFEK